MVARFTNIVLVAILFYLLAALSVSFVVSYKTDNIDILGDCVGDAAENYIKYENLIASGKRYTCSGFTSAVYKSCGYSLPNSAHDQYLQCTGLHDYMEKGDLVFFSINSSKISHVGIAKNDSIFIHSPGVNQKVRFDNIRSDYWSNYYIGSAKPLNFIKSD